MESIASIMEDHSEVDDHSLRYFVQSVKDVPEMHLTEQIEACIAIARRKILTMKVRAAHTHSHRYRRCMTPNIAAKRILRPFRCFLISLYSEAPLLSAQWP